MTRFSAILIAALMMACRPAETGIDRSVFIEVMVELRQAAKETTDSGAFDVRRRAILEQAGVTDSSLAAFVDRHTRDARYMAEVWDSIDRRLSPTEASADTTQHQP